MKCEKCGHESQPAPSGAAWHVPADMSDKCHVMLAGELKEHERKFVQDCRGKATMSDKQKKWFSAIYKQCFDAWPEFTPITDSPPARASTAAPTGALSDDQVPF